MKRVRIKPVNNRTIRGKNGKSYGTYSVSSSGKVTIRPKLPKR